MITVHHLENSRSQRILWLLEELGVDYDIKRYERNKKTKLAPPELKKIHPLGKSPLVTDGGITVAETGAIIEYILDTYGGGRLKPAPGTPEHRAYTYWMHAAEGTLMPLLVMRLVFNRVETDVPFFLRPIGKAISAQVNKAYLGPNIEANLGLANDTLTENEWFAGGEMTGADIMMSYPLEAISVSGQLGAEYGRLQGFVEKVHERPAYKRALERGGPYNVIPR